MKLKPIAAAMAAASTLHAPSVWADASTSGHSHYIEEIVVSAPFMRTTAETALPVTVLSGEKLQEQVADSLGATLQDEVGMANASFGPGVGQPIIRGQTGNRVQVLQNGAGVTDASNVSPDHANGVSTMLADRLEVIRGPSTLLYGSGAIGGVVNVIDGRVPGQLFEKPRFDVQQSWDSVNDESRTMARIDFSASNLSFHLEGFRQDSDEVEIDGFAIDELAVETLEEMMHGMHDHDEDHDDDHDEDHEDDHDEDHDDHEDHGDEVENTRGFIGNSDSESDGYSFGFSWVGDSGFIGLAYSELDKDYGLPFGVHAHGHGDEDHDDEHDEDHDDDHEEGHDDHGDEHGEVEFVRIGMEKKRIDLRGEYRFDADTLRTLRFSLGRTDYEHGEIEFFEDGTSEVGTLFENDGFEGRATLDLSLPGTWSAVLGTQFSSTEFSATGEEAYIPETEIDANGLFFVAAHEAERFSTELGIRAERNNVDPTGGTCDFNETSVSASGSVLYELDTANNLLFGVSRSERAPSVEELFSNIGTGCSRPADDDDLVLHAATDLLEIGNPNLDKETATNAEFGWRKHGGDFRAEINVYYNEISDYIYLNLTGQEVDEQMIATYASNDARFAGVEAKFEFNVMETDDLTLDWSIFGDTVRARFDDGGDIPRIAPGKVGTKAAFYGNRWSAHFGVTRVFEQDDVGPFELSTDGYTRVSLYGDYHWPIGNSGELKLFVQGSNMFDDQIRNHASLLKNYAPEPGKNVRIGLRFSY